MRFLLTVSLTEKELKDEYASYLNRNLDDGITRSLGEQSKLFLLKKMNKDKSFDTAIETIVSDKGFKRFYKELLEEYPNKDGSHCKVKVEFKVK